MIPRRILALMHEDLVPPETLDGYTNEQIAEWKTEYDVVTGLRELGHKVRALGVRDDLGVMRQAIEEFKPHIAFNMLEEFHGVALYDQHVVSYLELMRKPYTGCNPRGLTLAHDKGLSKKLLTYHRIPTPRFAVFPIGRRVRKPERLQYPLIVKSLIEHSSMGISQASVVHSDDKLAERVNFIHDYVGTDSIAEQYYDGRELYLAIIGNRILTTFPIWEMQFPNLPDGAPRIATAKVKWNEKYQKRIGLTIGPAKNLPEGIAERIARLGKRAYRLLGLTGYARLDWRLTPDGRIFLLEANPNPELAYDEEFASAAAHAGMDFEALLQKIVSLGIRYRAQWRG